MGAAGRESQTERKVGKVCTGRVRKCTSIRRVSAGWKVVGCALRGLGESKGGIRSVSREENSNGNVGTGRVRRE